MSAAYPMLNALPLPLMAFATWLFGAGAPLMPTDWAGIAMILAGLAAMLRQSLLAF